MSRTHYPIPTRHELVESPCWCGGDVFAPVATVDRFGQSLKTVMCCSCGTLLLNPYLKPGDAGRYYAEDYLQPGYNRGFAERVADRAHEQKHLFPLADRLKPGSDVLDFGCGCGGVTNFLIDRGHRVFGHDLSEVALDYAIGTGLLRHDPSDQKTYDAVVTYHSVEHHVDPHENAERDGGGS